MKIMFVCTGNTCRSAMAEAIFKDMVGNGIEVCSSGIAATTGSEASENTIIVCKNHGIDVSNHRATYFKDSDIEDMDLVLTATQLHTNKLKIYYPDLEIHTIREYAGEYPWDINDPFGGSLEAYGACFDEIYASLTKICEMLDAGVNEDIERDDSSSSKEKKKSA